MAFNNKLEKEKQKLITEKCQSILTQLLRDEDNKYCVDCDAKGHKTGSLEKPIDDKPVKWDNRVVLIIQYGPRWASWNLGIFLCIRCAGIHRNLGVHISKVKSVNLDAWTPEQIACIQNMGNSKARAVYEANLPDNFRRPQTDSSLEAFVRSKYEQKKYIAKEWVEPPPPKPAFDIEEELRKEKERKKNKKFQNQSPIEVQANPLPRPTSSPVSTAIKVDKIGVKSENAKSSADLLGLEIGTSGDIKGDDDSFGLFVSSVSANDTSKTENSENKTESKAKSDEESDFFNQKAPTDDKKVLSKESILSLYGSVPPPQPLLAQTQQPIVGPQNPSFNATNQSLFMGQFAPTSQPIPSQIQNSLFMSQNTAVSGIQTSVGQTPNLMNQSNFPLTTNPFLANTSSKSSNFGQQTVPQLSQNMASLQMNPMSVPNSSINPIVSNNWFPGGQPNAGLPVPPPGVINPFMTASPAIPAGVPFNNSMGQMGLSSGSLFPQSDAGSQWAFNASPINQTTAGMTASTNLWQ